jgi:inosine triphosphate pyrophosphatase
MTSAASVPKHLNFITGNKNKLAEVQAILDGVIELRNQNVDLVEIQGTVEEVTLDKARRAAEAVSLLFICILSLMFDYGLHGLNLASTTH